jgi:hypothetical protein
MKSSGTSAGITRPVLMGTGARGTTRRVTSAALAVGTAVVVSAAQAVPAAAATSGSETVSGTLVTSGVSGTRAVIGSVIIAKGVFDGVGRIAPVPNQPNDPPTVTRVDLVYSVGTMHLIATTVGFTYSRDPRSCLYKLSAQQTAEVTGGTGLFANAAGQFTQTFDGQGMSARNPDGSCSDSRPSVYEVDSIAASGTLSF